jgi:hypothetical protein
MDGSNGTTVLIHPHIDVDVIVAEEVCCCCFCVVVVVVVTKFNLMLLLSRLNMDQHENLKSCMILLNDFVCPEDD